jgi:hypothetical protein
MLRTPYYVSEQHSLFTLLAPQVPPSYTIAVQKHKKQEQMDALKASLLFIDKIDQVC